MPELSIIIVTWNSRADIERCLQALAASGTRTSTEILVADNASTDETAAFVQSAFPGVAVLASGTNAGSDTCEITSPRSTVPCRRGCLSQDISTGR